MNISQTINCGDIKKIHMKARVGQRLTFSASVKGVEVVFCAKGVVSLSAIGGCVEINMLKLRGKHLFIDAIVCVTANPIISTDLLSIIDKIFLI